MTKESRVNRTRQIRLLLMALVFITAFIVVPAKAFAAEWEVSKPEVRIEYDGTMDTWMEWVRITPDQDDELFSNANSLTSNNEAVATAEWDVKGHDFGIYCHSLGTAMITVLDKDGNAGQVYVSAKAPPLKFEPDFKTTLTYDEYGGEETYIRLDSSCTTHIKSFSTNDGGKVIKVTGDKDGNGYYDTLEVASVGRGKATLTVKDELGQTKSLAFTVGAFLDQSYFETENTNNAGSYDSKAMYGDTKLTVHCNEAGARVYFTLGGKYYIYTLKGKKATFKIPRITDSKVSVTFNKDGIEYTSTAKVSKKPASALKAKAKSVTYNGKAQKPKVIVKDGDHKLKKGTDYTVKYKGNKNIGRGKATITFKGHYKGTKKVSFEVMPKGTSIRSLSAGKGKITIKWKKNKAVDGYDIEYSNKKNFENVAAGSAKKGDTIEYRGHKVTDRMFDGLTSGKTYYARVRTFKVVKGRYIYSEWSKVKKVVVK